jgi:hypothetical protein
VDLVTSRNGNMGRSQCSEATISWSTHLETSWFSRGQECYDWHQQHDSIGGAVSIPTQFKTMARPVKHVYVREGKREERGIDVTKLSSSSSNLPFLFYLCSTSATMYFCQLIWVTEVIHPHIPCCSCVWVDRVLHRVNKDVLYSCRKMKRKEVTIIEYLVRS